MAVRVDVRSDLEVSRHLFGGEAAYVVRDPVTFQSHRLSAANYQIFVAINSDEKLGDTFTRLCDAKLTREENRESFYRFVLQLNQLGLLSLPVNDGKTLYERYARRRAAEIRSKLLGFLFLRVPLIQPDALLKRTVCWVAPLFSRAVLLIWLVGLLAGSYLVWVRWDEFQNPLGTILAVQNLPILWGLLVGLKVIHEFGHAYACKHLGGNVPEMGAYFIVFTPCAYVDASDSWGFSKRTHRIIVALAGMYFESIIGIVAVFVWSITGPGVVNAAAHYSVILSTMMTIGFNANPLMKYDGYFVLSDLLGMPNLRGDAQRELSGVLRRVFVGEQVVTNRSRARRIALILFGICCSLYKVVVVFGISMLIALKVPALGAAIAALYVGNTIRRQGYRLVLYVAGLESRPQRYRAVAATVIMAGITVGAITFVPGSGSRTTPGLMEREHQYMIRAGVSGFLTQVEVKEGDPIDAGDLICRLENVDVAGAVERTEAQLAERRLQLQRDVVDLHAASLTNQAIEKIRHEHERNEAKFRELEVRAPAAGDITDLEVFKEVGQFVRKGTQIATLCQGAWLVTTLVTADDFSQASPEIGDVVTVRLADLAHEEYEGQIISVAMAGSQVITHDALTHLGGGAISVTRDTKEAQQPFFQIVVALTGPTDVSFRLGMSAWVRFPSARMSIGMHLYRRGLTLLNQLRLAS